MTMVPKLRVFVDFDDFQNIEHLDEFVRFVAEHIESMRDSGSPHFPAPLRMQISVSKTVKVQDFN